MTRLTRKPLPQRMRARSPRAIEPALAHARPGTAPAMSRTPPVQGRLAARRAAAAAARRRAGMQACAARVCRCRLYRPPGMRGNPRPALVVMLHGCSQDALSLAASSRMNQVAAREGFLVVYPGQDRNAHPHGCWNWYQTRSGQAQREAASLDAAIARVCRVEGADPRRVVLAGFSAGAAMAVLLGTVYPARYRAVAMHSGVGAGVAHSAGSALSAMQGRYHAPKPHRPPVAAAAPHPALLVIHGSADDVVVPANGVDAAVRWAADMGARAGAPRVLRRGGRYAMTVTDYHVRGRLAVSHRDVHGLGHAWSGGAAGLAWSDPRGPDAARMIWTFAKRQFAPARARR